MATVAEFSLDAREFPLGTVFAELPDVTVQLERVIPTKNSIIPYFWVRGTKTENMVEKFSTHPGVHSISVVDTVGDEYLMRCEWVADYETVLDALVVPEIVLVSAIGTASEWAFEIRGETRETIAAFRDYCHSHDIPVELRELHSLTQQDVIENLTSTQREALQLAFENGYFKSPRETTLAELADELEISQQATGSRIQRGTRRILKRYLAYPS